MNQVLPFYMLVFQCKGLPGYKLSDFSLSQPDSLSLNLVFKRILTLTSSSLQLNRVNGTSSPQSPLSTSGRVAAVGPYIQVPSTGGFPLPGDPVKPQSLTIASSAAHGRSKSGRFPQSSALGSTWREWCGGGTSPYLCI